MGPRPRGDTNPPRAIPTAALPRPARRRGRRDAHAALVATNKEKRAKYRVGERRVAFQTLLSHARPVRPPPIPNDAPLQGMT